MLFCTLAGGPKTAPSINVVRSDPSKTLVKNRHQSWHEVSYTTFLNISAENYTGMWFKSNTTGISFVDADMTE